MLTLHDLLSNILSDYPRNEKIPLKGSYVAGLLRNGLNNIKGMDMVLKGNIISKGSAGQGSWAFVPWIGVFNKSISTSAQNGIDLVYLFSTDGKTAYLSLNQGWTVFKKKYKLKEAKIQIKAKASELRGTLEYINPNINDNPIDLNSTKDNPVGYELGNILSIKYTKDNLPNNDQLMNDLMDMVELLNNLENQLTFNNGKDYELKDSYNEFIKKRNLITNGKRNVNDLNYKKQKAPENISPNSNVNSSRVTKIDYERSNKLKSSLGQYGEDIVMKIEKDRLNKCHREDLASKVEHVSETIGDGLGYDIKSFDENGNPLYIEVKSTTRDANSTFNITRNELYASQKYYDSYKLYRVYNINLGTENPYCDYYVVEGDLNKKLNLVPVSYIAGPK